MSNSQIRLKEFINNSIERSEIAYQYLEKNIELMEEIDHYVNPEFSPRFSDDNVSDEPSFTVLKKNDNNSPRFSDDEFSGEPRLTNWRETDNNDLSFSDDDFSDELRLPNLKETDNCSSGKSCLF